MLFDGQNVFAKWPEVPNVDSIISLWLFQRTMEVILVTDTHCQNSFWIPQQATTRKKTPLPWHITLNSSQAEPDALKRKTPVHCSMPVKPYRSNRDAKTAQRVSNHGTLSFLSSTHKQPILSRTLWTTWTRPPGPPTRHWARCTTIGFWRPLTGLSDQRDSLTPCPNFIAPAHARISQGSKKSRDFKNVT